jgi:hypothetical protein
VSIGQNPVQFWIFTLKHAQIQFFGRFTATTTAAAAAATVNTSGYSNSSNNNVQHID